MIVMKQIIAALALLITNTVNAQVQIITAVDTSLYVGIDNPVTIRSATIPLKELTSRTSNGSISGKDGNYVIKCSKAGPAVLLDVVHRNKVVASKMINVHLITDPVVYPLGEKLFTDTFISKKNLSTIQSLVVKLNYPLANFSVVSFTTEIIRNGKSTGTLQNSGRNLSVDSRTFLNMTVPGDEVIFDAIGIETANSGRKFVPAVKLRITE